MGLDEFEANIEAALLQESNDLDDDAASIADEFLYSDPHSDLFADCPSARY